MSLEEEIFLVKIYRLYCDRTSRTLNDLKSKRSNKETVWKLWPALDNILTFQLEFSSKVTWKVLIYYFKNYYLNIISKSVFTTHLLPLSVTRNDELFVQDDFKSCQNTRCFVMAYSQLILITRLWQGRRHRYEKLLLFLVAVYNF